MQLNDVRPSVDSSGGMEEEFFSIEDQGMIFDILRNKMYSNPILAIAREISSNARDAHREVGTPDVPIHIHLPTNIEPYYKIKDFGPGISPERMSNVFIRYTASTKRVDNLQTGGFGLGAKTPFSYSDTFTIVTNVNGIKYNYACYIDETKVGKLTLLSEATTDEPNGTEIIIPVSNTRDFNSFAESTKQATQYWDVKPVIKGGHIEYDERKTIIEGDGWRMIHGSNSYYHRDIRLIIDGIEYPLDGTAAYELGDRNMIDSSRGLILFYFGVGELTLAANREHVYLDDATKAKIRERFNVMKSQIVQSVKDRILKMDNLWQANVYYQEDVRKAFNNVEFLGKLDWCGYALNNRYNGIFTGCRVFEYKKGVSRSWRKPADPEKVSRSDRRGSISIKKNCALFVNDLPLFNPTGRHVRKAFDEDPGLESVQVVCPNKTVTEQDLNDKIHLDMMKPRRLSEITKASGKKRASGTRLILFRYETERGNFQQISYSTYKNDMSHKVLCRTRKDEWNSNIRKLVSNDYRIPNMSDLCHAFPNTTFYAVDTSIPEDRVKESLYGCQDFDSFVKETVVDSDIDFVKIKAVKSCITYNVKNMSERISTLADMIKDPNSVALKFLAAEKMLGYVGSENAAMLRLYEFVVGYISDKQVSDFILEHPYMDIGKFYDKFNQTYPLLNYLDCYQSNALKRSIADYINLIDEKNSKEE